MAATMSSKQVLLFASDLSSQFFSALHAIVLIAIAYGRSKACQIQAYESLHAGDRRSAQRLREFGPWRLSFPRTREVSSATSARLFALALEGPHCAGMQGPMPFNARSVG